MDTPPYSTSILPSITALSWKTLDSHNFWRKPCQTSCFIARVSCSSKKALWRMLGFSSSLGSMHRSSDGDKSSATVNKPKFLSLKRTPSAVASSTTALILENRPRYCSSWIDNLVRKLPDFDKICHKSELPFWTAPCVNMEFSISVFCFVCAAHGPTPCWEITKQPCFLLQKVQSADIVYRPLMSKKCVILPQLATDIQWDWCCGLGWRVAMDTSLLVVLPSVGSPCSSGRWVLNFKNYCPSC